jgi:geranylgeranyl diphosphate synthase type II
MLIGCTIAEKEGSMEDVTEYSKNLGIAFQIVDDILDCVGDTSKLGKNVGRDEACHKSTFVSILGIEKAREMAVEYSNNALAKARILDNTGFLASLTEYLLNRDN